MSKEIPLQTTAAAESDFEVGKVLDVSLRGLDEAAAFAQTLEGDIAYSKKEEKSLRWKIDLRLIPILWFNVTLGAMDKVSNGVAATYGLREATDSLDGNRYAWIGSVFYLGYLVASFPSAILLQKWPIAKTISISTGLWGVILIGMGGVQNYATMIALRILMGILEACVVPGNFLIISMWYTRHEQPLRTGLMYTGLSTVFTGIFGYCVGFIGNKEQFRYFFYIIGGMTVIYSILMGIFLPDSPVRAKFLNDRERAIAIDRIRVNQTGVESKTFKKEQMIEAFKDPKTWIMFAFNLFISMPNGGLTNFAPLIITKGLKYDPQHSALLNITSGVIQTLSSYMCNGGVFLADKYFPKYHTRGAFMIFGSIVGCVSTVFLYTLSTTAIISRLLALFFAFFYLGPYIVGQGLCTANTSGHTKKVTVNAMMFIAYCISNIIGPQFFKTSQAPFYPLGVGALFFSYGASVLLILSYMAYCHLENKRRDRLDTAAGERVHSDTDFKDLTDWENVHFRYLW